MAVHSAEMLTTVEPEPGLDLEAMPQAEPEESIIAASRAILASMMGDRDPSTLSVGELREVIDATDALWLAALGARVLATQHVGERKADAGAMGVGIDLQRENTVVMRAADGTRELGIDPILGVNIAAALISVAHRQYNDARRGKRPTQSTT